MDKKLLYAINSFLDAFEVVFDMDWWYTKACLEGDYKMGCEESFIKPKVDDEYNDWCNRGVLLKAYRELVYLLGSKALRINIDNEDYPIKDDVTGLDAKLPPLDERQEEIKKFIRQPEEKKAAFFEHLFAGVKHERIRDFIVTEDNKDENKSFIIHIASGFWHGLTVPYEEARERLLQHPEQDQELIQRLFD